MRCCVRGATSGVGMHWQWVGVAQRREAEERDAKSTHRDLGGLAVQDAQNLGEGVIIMQGWLDGCAGEHALLKLRKQCVGWRRLAVGWCLVLGRRRPERSLLVVGSASVRCRSASVRRAIARQECNRNCRREGRQQAGSQRSARMAKAVAVEPATF